VAGSIVYLPCLSGPIAVQVSDSPAGLRLLWRSSVGGGPPILAGWLVWTIGSNGVLSGLDPSTGAVTEHAVIGAPANHFPTPSIGEGLLLAPSSNRVVAFTATTTTASASTTTTVLRATTTSVVPTEQPAGANAWIVAAAIVGGLGLLAAAVWLFRRRRQADGAA
jgi:LPXTG-motif cell wall-anchored protein